MGHQPGETGKRGAHRDLAEYRDRYRHVAMRRDEAGVLEVRLHSDGGPLTWGALPHEELGFAFQDIGSDPDNRVVVITGTGDEFLARLDDSWVGPMDPVKWDSILRNGRRLMEALLDIGVPVIAAVNGPATVHAEIAVLSDVVIAAESAVFSDSPHFRYGTVPGDGVHVIWPLLLGPNRGRYFLLTGQRIDAAEALRLGVVNEVLPDGDLMGRARDLAAALARQPTTTLRYTRQALVHPLKQRMASELGLGLALEGLASYESWPAT